MFLRRDLLLISVIFNIVNVADVTKSRSHFEIIATLNLPHDVTGYQAEEPPVTTVPDYILDPRSIKEGMDPYAYSGTFMQCSDYFYGKVSRDTTKYRWLRECCDQIEKCEDYILPRDTKYGITNNEAFKWLNCECDYEFRTCLLEPPYESNARALGKSYFNIIRPKCFLKMKSGTCNNLFYDVFGNPHEINPLNAYYCVNLYEQKPFDYNIQP
uniref:phospholipase A2 n=1 Tax=Ampulex compressa TaxID=860918 RepID=A0A1W6EVX4_AMPCP|nr:venom protein [Ampulex compressa]